MLSPRCVDIGPVLQIFCKELGEATSAREWLEQDSVLERHVKQQLQRKIFAFDAETSGDDNDAPCNIPSHMQADQGGMTGEEAGQKETPSTGKSANAEQMSARCCASEERDHASCISGQTKGCSRGRTQRISESPGGNPWSLVRLDML